jgi:mannose-6-phosphate isomerase-like protein (cupin superfamily)
MQKKSFDTPDETMAPPKTKVEIVKVGGVTLMRDTFAPGWKWSVDVGPAAGTDRCQTHHVLCMISGRLKIDMADGSETEIGPGDVADIPAGHDAWVVGDEAAIAIDAGGCFN